MWECGNAGMRECGSVCAVPLTFVCAQIWGPVRARFDTRLALHTSGSSALPRQLDTVVGWDVGLPQALGVAKLVGWFSPTRREAMIEFKFPER